MSGDADMAWQRKHAARALLGYALETRLAGQLREPGISVPGPWDIWWACCRAGLPPGALQRGVRFDDHSCPRCTRSALMLAARRPPGHPGQGTRPCGCLRRWAEAMRAPGPRPDWPPSPLSLALIKPGSPATAIARQVSDAFGILAAYQVQLTVADTRRLYPEAYGAEYVQARDAYLTSGRAQVLILLASQPAADASALKARIRGQADGDALRNHLHMPDNPGEALADIAHFAGYRELAQLYRRYQHDDSSRRLAFYRAALGISPAGPDRLPAAG